MPLATFAHAVPLFLIGAAFLAAGLGLATVLIRAARRSYIVLALLHWGFAVLFGVGGIVAGVVSILLGIVVAGCPPDAFECP